MLKMRLRAIALLR